MFKLLNLLNDHDFLTMTGWTGISCSRLLMAVMSLWIDFCVYKICKITKVDHSNGVLLIASSYVTLTYQCHTFTNSFESLLFSSVVYVILSSSNDLMNRDHRKVAKKKSKLVKTKRTDSDIDRSSKNMKRKPYGACVALGVISVFGIFNRPTFVIFTLVPSLWWLYILVRYSKCSKEIILQTLIILVSAVLSSIMCCVIDSVYFKNLSFSLILSEASNCLPFSIDTLNCHRNIVARHFVFTPLNFVLYNTKGDNLAKHGLHPCYLHFFVNMPLLFGPIIIHLLKSLPACLKDVFSCFCKCLSFIKSVLFPYHSSEIANNDNNFARIENGSGKTLIVLFIIIPVLILSVFPHQEPRFLIPLLPLIVILTVLSAKSFSKFFLALFVIFNVILTIIFGIFHQGGVIPCILKLQTLYNTDQIKNNSNILYNFIFSHTYMPPQFPLLIQSSKVKVWDLKGSNSSVISTTINTIKKSSENQHSSDSRIFLVIPATVYTDMVDTSIFNVTLIEKFFPHLSFEDLPHFSSWKEHDWLTRLKTVYDQLFLMLFEID